MSVIDSASNGATEIPGSSHDALFVFLAGPIRCWWAPGMWGSPAHATYTTFRDLVHAELSADFLVYAPHRAWRGPWNEAAQRVNDHAIALSDALVWLDVPGQVADGTAAEVDLARRALVPTHRLAVDDHNGLDLLVEKLRLLAAARHAARHRTPIETRIALHPQSPLLTQTH